MDLQHRLHSSQATLKSGVLPLELLNPWILCLRLPASLSRRQPRFGDLVTLAAPARQKRRVQALSTQQGSDIAVTLAAIGLAYFTAEYKLRIAATLRLLNHFGILDPRRIAADGICRVGMAGRPTTPLTEPDLWASHPALWNEFFMVKQRKLTRDQLHSV